MSILKSNKFGLSPELYSRFRDVLKEVVEELIPQDRLYPKTLGVYLRDLGNLLFLGDLDEKAMVKFMALVSEYYNNEDTDNDVE